MPSDKVTPQYPLSRAEEKANALTHGVSALFLLLSLPTALGYLLRQPDLDLWPAGLSVLVFILCLVLMFTASAVYHILPADHSSKRFWNQLDHMAIFLAIAGSYTPIALTVIGGTAGWLLFAAEWLLVLAGILFKAVGFRRNRLTWIISILMYLGMGWGIVLCMPLFLRTARPANVGLIIAGGLFYTSGLIFFAQRWRHSHLVWHFFVMGGAFCHYVAIVFFLGRPAQ